MVRISFNAAQRTATIYGPAGAWEMETEWRTDGTCQVRGSFRVRPPRGIRARVSALKAAAPEGTAPALRSAASLRREWMAHNMLYFVGFQRARTADVDFEARTGRVKAFCYFALSALYRAAWRLF